MAPFSRAPLLFVEVLSWVWRSCRSFSPRCAWRARESFDWTRGTTPTHTPPTPRLVWLSSISLSDWVVSMCVCVCVCVCVCACFFSISGRSGFACFSTCSFFGLFCAKCPSPLLSLPPLLYSRVAAADGSFHVNQEHAGWAKNQCAWVVQKAALSECQVGTVTYVNIFLCFHYNAKIQHT